MHVHDKNVEKRRLNGLVARSSMKVFGAFGDLGQQVYADGALSKKHKELTALAIAVSQNCFD
jgi:alkylhydroperoxidase/carboxymuconolactone decarboxylase family protein YurZ